ncbi:hypothetical protein N9Y17_00715 [Gammaproteobacteria bacterium]|nr:hypothetical protein [Gammaproteobacteria bacterium]
MKNDRPVDLKRARSFDLVFRFSNIIGWWKRLFWLRILFPSIQFVVLALCIKVSTVALFIGAFLAFLCYHRFADYFSETDKIQNYTLFHFIAAMYTIGELLLSISLFNFASAGIIIFSLSVGLSLAYWIYHFDDFYSQLLAYQQVALTALARPHTYQKWLTVLVSMSLLTFAASLLVSAQWLPTTIYFLSVLMQVTLVSAKKGQGLNQAWNTWLEGKGLKAAFESFKQSYGRQQAWEAFGLWNTMYFLLFQFFSLVGMPWLSLSGFSIILPVTIAVFSVWVSEIIVESDLNPITHNVKPSFEMNHTPCVKEQKSVVNKEFNITLGKPISSSTLDGKQVDAAVSKAPNDSSLAKSPIHKIDSQ